MRVAPPRPSNRSKPDARGESGGLRYGRDVVGKHLFRVREQHVAEHLIPLIRHRALGAAKLDIVLRGIALLPAHTGRRPVGLVLPRHSWEHLHDLARRADHLGSTPADIDASREVIRLKRKWVGEQLARLEELRLLRRTERPGRRPGLIVLRDDASTDPFDDPDGTEGNRYVTLLGTIIASGKLATWGSPELSAYLAAMVAERHDTTSRARTRRPPGSGSWFRPLTWFADQDRRYGSDARLRMPFSTATLERGLKRLENDGLLQRQRILTHPVTGTRLQGRRNRYTNRFHLVDGRAQVLKPEEYAAEIDEESTDIP